MLSSVRMRSSQEGGATAVEYAIMAMAIAALIVVVVLLLGRQTRSNFCEAGWALEGSGRVRPSDVGSACA